MADLYTYCQNESFRAASKYFLMKEAITVLGNEATETDQRILLAKKAVRGEINENEWARAVSLNPTVAGHIVADTDYTSSLENVVSTDWDGSVPNVPLFTAFAEGVYG